MSLINQKNPFIMDLNTLEDLGMNTIIVDIGRKIQGSNEWIDLGRDPVQIKAY